ncbi:unnamed protein product [Allacma fusca]|uniref:Uncharacterized protein n=1 Tax=Allacma fusca TaxID=39272 RepID=A0A8J2JYU9_9HEXA|nr:unnamed protein product [Allacma fusca]
MVNAIMIYRKKEETTGYFPIKILLLILCSIPALASMSPKQRLESSKLRKNSSVYSPDDFLRQGIGGENSSWPEVLLRRPSRQTHLPRNDLENGSVIPADRKSKLIHHSSSGSEEDQSRQRFGEHCECWNFSDGHIREVECSCTQLTSNMTLPQEIHRIRKYNAIIMSPVGRKPNAPNNQQRCEEAER